MLIIDNVILSFSSFPLTAGGAQEEDTQQSEPQPNRRNYPITGAKEERSESLYSLL
jgi:hypothetical protein